MPYTRRWTPEEEAALRELWGKCTVPTIAEKLGRSRSAVRQRVTEMGLGSYTASDDGISVYRLLCTIYNQHSRTSAFYRARKWIDAGLPIYHRTVTRRSVRMVRLNRFWTWARKHPELVDFSAMPEGALGAEPGWMKARRETDLANAPWSYRHWTPHEDAVLYALCSDPAHPPELRALIARLRRGEVSIRSRIYRLGLEPPAPSRVKHLWTPEELATLRTLRARGCAWQHIADQLDRSAIACKFKYRKLEAHDHD